MDLAILYTKFLSSDTFFNLENKKRESCSLEKLTPPTLLKKGNDVNM